MRQCQVLLEISNMAGMLQTQTRTQKIVLLILNVGNVYNRIYVRVLWESWEMVGQQGKSEPNLPGDEFFGMEILIKFR